MKIDYNISDEKVISVSWASATQHMVRLDNAQLACKYVVKSLSYDRHLISMSNDGCHVSGTMSLLR